VFRFDAKAAAWIVCLLALALACGKPEPDAMPLECTPWFEEGTAPPGLQDVGVCAVL
jgi:hypothetical protein